MISFLSTKRTKEGFFQKISSEPPSTRRIRMAAISNFEKFTKMKYDGRDAEKICEELNTLEGQERENALYDMLQDWINWNCEEGYQNSTIKLMFTSIKKFLYYKGIKTDQQDIRENLKFGKIITEEKYPLSDDEYRAIVNAFGRNPRRQALYLSLGSSGMRIGEALKLRKRDLDFSHERIKINLHADITKTKRGRTTYISKEAQKLLRPILDKLNPEDLVFTKEYEDPHDALIVERNGFLLALNRLGLNARYESNNFLKITSHSFRSYFFTKAARKHGENYAHKLIGHDGYLMQYDRMTEEDKLKMYIELEPELVIFDQTKNELEISKLREENQSIKELKEELRKLKENQARQDKEIMEKMIAGGILPKPDSGRL